ncbi:MAG: Gfo/Idh/MocA family oxidoreductase [Dysgonamonadaceae bacterium]|jgi:predicted dehydrogenase|nr:Gfo/Idh/MocA family oxidoreductase [Dysgonamonadaceae bacterium]
MSNSISRRSFLQKGGTVALGLTGLSIIPSTVLGKSFGAVNNIAPSDKLNIAGIGIGGRGSGVLKGLSSQNIVGLCDIDWKYSENVFKTYPNAKKYWDYRKLFDEMGNSIDAVMVATADHTHAIIASQAMTMGKHVYCEKPLTHSVYESRLLTKLAAKHNVATQMGNQGSSAAGVRQICDWIWNGEIGEIRKVEAFTDRPIWPQGMNTPTQGEWVPETLNWELFTGPAKLVPFNSIYHPWNWRGWWNYGTGALGDMACHILHPVFKSLKLGYPTKVQGSSTLLLTDCAPTAQSVRFTFPARTAPDVKKVKFPEVEVFWSDGGIRPEMPAGWPAGKNMNDDGGCVIFHGTKDTLICGCYGIRPWLLSGRTPSVPKTQREVTEGHQMDWVRACKESPESRVKSASDFSEAGPFNEMVVMGVLAVRLQHLHKELEWDGDNMQFKNISDTDKFNMVLADGFKIVDGHPSFKNPEVEINAKSFAQELIKHTYRTGWSLPAMP